MLGSSTPDDDVTYASRRPRPGHPVLLALTRITAVPLLLITRLAPATRTPKKPAAR